MSRRCLPKGKLESAEFIREQPTFIPLARKMRGARRAGLVYQSKVIRNLTGHFGERCLSEPWFVYSVNGNRYWCAPDFIILPESDEAALGGCKVGVIGECKLTYRPRAEFKLRQLYAPVVAKALGIEQLKFVQVARNLRPDMGDPLLERVHDIFTSDCEYAVIHWRL